MSSQPIGWAVVFIGVAVMSLSAIVATARPRVFDRLHLLTTTTSVGAPLIGLGLVILRGWSQASAMIIVITVLVVLSAPVVSSATGRLTADLDGVLDQDRPK
ncbi:monovalent cation/H(+) antiporter subunit G [Mycobacterium angelicum]|uniref:Cation:proton antiporter n=1 Tax=Mycobacterium angelicum TaxID=470074 RepID=A0A1X0A5V1_MYCAN|nr:monovalent cation/H(+) antiporter subunit G [Mycobacterium angelicum]MCV7197138.1 monovalent cation/H(+) antiporter subunit G [Mycobacterium angelicum]ORA25372.1 hypothetical protein BST12_03565 [Mycobacterium angelicum]